MRRGGIMEEERRGGGRKRDFYGLVSWRPLSHSYSCIGTCETGARRAPKLLVGGALEREKRIFGAFLCSSFLHPGVIWTCPSSDRQKSTKLFLLLISFPPVFFRESDERISSIYSGVRIEQIFTFLYMFLLYFCVAFFFHFCLGIQGVCDAAQRRNGGGGKPR